MATYAHDMTMLYGDGTGSFTALGGGASGLNDETDFYIQGTSCKSKNAWTNNIKGMIHNYGGAIVPPVDGCVMFWIYYSATNSLEVKEPGGSPSNGGLMALIGSASNAYRRYNVAGRDTLLLDVWGAYPVSPGYVAADDTVGSPAAPWQWVGVEANLPTTAGPTKGAPLAVDAMWFGRGKVSYTSTACSFGDAIASYLDAQRTGLLTALPNLGHTASAVRAYLQGLHLIGKTTGGVATAVVFSDTNGILFIPDRDKIHPDFNRIEIWHATSVVTFTGTKFISFNSVSPGTFYVDSVVDDVTLTDCELRGLGDVFLATGNVVTGTLFQRLTGTIDCAGPLRLSGSSLLLGSPGTDAAQLEWWDDVELDDLVYDNTVTTEETDVHAITFKDGGAAEYSEAEAGGWFTVGYSAGYEHSGQAFTSLISKPLTGASFYLKTNGATGLDVTFKAKLYTVSGTYGTSAVPGTLLATSEEWNAIGLTGTPELVQFRFSGSYSLVYGTQYVITIERQSGSSSKLLIGYDGPAAGYAGNMCGYGFGAWGAFPGYALAFYVNPAAELNLHGMTFAGHGSGGDESAGAHFNFERATGAVTLNLFTSEHGDYDWSSKSAGVEVTLVENPVTTRVTALDQSLAAVADARAFVRADGPGRLAYVWPAGITRSGAVATAEVGADHGMRVADKVMIKGATQSEYNGIKTITALPSAKVLQDGYTLIERGTGGYQLVDSSFTAYGQAFEVPSGFGGALSGIRVWLRPYGAPTGTITAKLYSLTGTFGSTAVPNALLATGHALNVTQLPADFNYHPYSFPFVGAEAYTLVAGTQYFLVLEGSGFTTTQLVRIYGDAAGTHPGNMAFKPAAGSWTAIAAADLFFSVWVGGHQFQYAVSGTPDSPATGSPLATGVIIDTVTDADGEASDLRSFGSAPQRVAGRVRKMTDSPLFKNAPIQGTVGALTGFETTVKMIPDE